MKTLTPFIVALLILETGCTTTKHSDSYGIKDHTPSTAQSIDSPTLQSGKKGLSFLSINGEEVKQSRSNSQVSHAVDEGYVTVTIEAYLGKGLAGYGDIRFMAERGRHYYATYEKSENTVKIYIIDSESDSVLSECISEVILRQSNMIGTGIRIIVL